MPGVGASRHVHGGPAHAGERIIAEQVAAGLPVPGGLCRYAEFCLLAGSGGADARLRALAEARDHSTQGPGDLSHAGWNVVDSAAGSALFKGWTSRFVHSYAAHNYGKGHPARCWPGPTYRAPFLAAVEDALASPGQFHPEKSGDAGASRAEQLG